VEDAQSGTHATGQAAAGGGKTGNDFIRIGVKNPMPNQFPVEIALPGKLPRKSVF
jgi:hypothetical protein